MHAVQLGTITLPGVTWDWVFCAAFLLLLAGIALYAKAVPQGDRRWWGLLVLLAALVISGQASGSGLGRMLLLDAAAFVGVAMIWLQGTPQAVKTARLYLAFLAASVLFILAGVLLGGETETAPAFPIDKLVVGLIVVGFSLKLALVPFYFWLPSLAENAKPMTAALVISVVDIAAFGELAHLRLSMPWVFTSFAPLWLALALLSMYAGALLALAQTNLKRMLAFSTIDDMGYLILGVLIGSQFGLSGALLAALSHAFFKVLLFGAVGLAESKLGRDLTFSNRGLATQFPVSAAVFCLASLGMIGVPPLFGFVGRWRLYLAGVEYGGFGLVLAMAGATALTLLYYIRAIHRVWFGQPDEAIAAGEPRLASAVLIVFILLMLAAGLVPGWLTGLLS